MENETIEAVVRKKWSNQMENETIETVVRKTLEKEYLLIKKGKWWFFLVGLVGFMLVAGFVSYEAALKAVKSEVNGFSDQLNTLRSDLSSGKLTVRKAEMLKARDEEHWFRFRKIDRSNHDVFELWRTDDTWHQTIRVEAAAKLLARDDMHWLRFHSIISPNYNFFRLWKYDDNSWHSTIMVTAAEELTH